MFTQWLTRRHRVGDVQRLLRRHGRARGVSWDGPALEALEPRTLMSNFSWTAEEVYLLELVNRARSDPMAEGARLGIDLTAGLTDAELARLVPQEPLALNPLLTTASRLHSQDMADRAYFDHVDPDGNDPTDRAQAQGYAGTAGENIAAGYQSIDEVHAAWLESLGHRKNVLSLFASFSNSFHYTEFGAGVAHTDIGPYFDYHTEMFGYQGTSPVLYALGVVYDDVDGNNFYGMGEGMGLVRVDLALTSDPNNVVASYTTDAAGNYQIGAAPGDYTVTFRNMTTGGVYTQSLTLSDVNVKIDAKATDFHAPDVQVPTDDHANAGDFANATRMSINAFTGEGADAGKIDAGDTDLFRFTASRTARFSISLLDGAGLNGRLRIFNADGIAIGTGVAGSVADSVFTLHTVRNQTYYVLVEPTDSGTGQFALAITGLPDDGVNPNSPVISGAGDASATITLAMLDAQAHPMVYQQDGIGGWKQIDLFDFAGGPDTSGDVQMFVDPHDGLSYAVARSDAGLVLFRQASDHTWTFRNLTAEIAGSGLIESDLGVFTTMDGKVYASGLDASGDLIVYRQTGSNLSDGRHEWEFVNIAESELRANGMQMPQFVGPLTAYVTSWNGLNIAGLDAAGQIQTVWWAPGAASWTATNLSAITGAPALSGALTAYMTPWDGINLAGIDKDGKLSVTWWVPQFVGDWVNTNLTDQYSGPILQASTVASYVTGWGGLNVAGVDANGDVQVYWWAPGLDNWRVTNLTLTVSTAPLAGAQLTGVTVAANGDINVFGTNSDGDIIRFWWEIGGNWQVQNVSNLVG